jgi:chemotaxis protein methyltransferase CheR
VRVLVTAPAAASSPRASDAECVRFLEWALPRLQLHWRGFRRVRGQVEKRLRRRLAALALPDLAAYRARLAEEPSEWAQLDLLCRVSISRFYRDRAVWDSLRTRVLPELALAARSRGERALAAWSAGCAAGEEPYTLAILWREALARDFPDLTLRIVASDVDEPLLARARAARYPRSSLRELPDAFASRSFSHLDGLWRLDPELARSVEFARGDLRVEQPDGPFDLVLCRNVAFTYFDLALRREVAARIAAALLSGGALVLGLHEALPPESLDFEPWQDARCVYRRRAEPRTQASTATASASAS